MPGVTCMPAIGPILNLVSFYLRFIITFEYRTKSEPVDKFVQISLL